MAFCNGDFEEERNEREKMKNEKKKKEKKRIKEFSKFYNEMFGIPIEEFKEEVKLSEDEKEKIKLVKLQNIKKKRNLNNNIFTESVIFSYLPEIPKNNFEIPENEIEVKKKVKKKKKIIIKK